MHDKNTKIKVFIDGSAGTTGLRIRERLFAREDVTLLPIEEEKRKELSERLRLMNAADVAFLCLPDDAAREIADASPDTVLIDTSTAHRTKAGWSYGFPELSEKHRSAVSGGRRIAVPGCHAGGFISLVYPLRAAGVLREDFHAICFSVTGYSGGGKKMIAEYENAKRDPALDSPRQYGLSQTHKHLPEMQAVCGLTAAPVFCPIVADFYSGMEVTVPLLRENLPAGMTKEKIREILAAHYAGAKLVRVRESCDDSFLPANAFSGRDCMEIGIYGNDDRILLVSRFDNLGKGASGAAVQCMNLAMGLEETVSLAL